MPERHHKSTTHEELYFHIPLPNHRKVSHATVFARREKEPTPTWCISVAFCSVKDEFNRHRGRTIARRHYFMGRNKPFSEDKPTYQGIEEAVINGPW